MRLEEKAFPGLHERVISLVPKPFGGGRAIDLGCGSGAFAERLRLAGWAAEGADITPESFGSDLPFHLIDLNDPQTQAALPGDFDLVTAIEVIEHTEAPALALRTIAALLAPQGLAILTTPNVDSIYARFRFLIRGKLKAMDEWGDPTHISPIFMSLLPRLLERSGLHLAGLESFDGLAGRPAFRTIMRILGRVDRLRGDSHILLLRRH